MNSQPAKTTTETKPLSRRIKDAFAQGLEKSGADEIELLGYLVAGFIGLGQEASKDYYLDVKEQIGEALMHFSQPAAVENLPESLRSTLSNNPAHSIVSVEFFMMIDSILDRPR